VFDQLHEPNACPMDLYNVLKFTWFEGRENGEDTGYQAGLVDGRRQEAQEHMTTKYVN
jgi:hypothetical protein